MELKEIKKRKKKLESDIFKLLTGFERDTATQITGIFPNTASKGTSRTVVVEVEVRVEIP